MGYGCAVGAIKRSTVTRKVSTPTTCGISRENTKNGESSHYQSLDCAEIIPVHVLELKFAVVSTCLFFSV